MPYNPSQRFPTKRKLKVDVDVFLSKYHPATIKNGSDANILRIYEFLDSKFQDWSKKNKDKMKKYSADWFSVVHSHMKMDKDKHGKWIITFREDMTHYHYPTNSVLEIWKHKKLPITANVHTFNDTTPKPATVYMRKLLLEAGFKKIKTIKK